MAGVGSSTRPLEHTPTWAFATICFIIIAISIILEHSIRLITNWLERHRKRALNDAVDRLKSELMLLGFMSLLLAVTQVQITKICIPTRLADFMLPCRKPVIKQTTKVLDFEHVTFRQLDEEDTASDEGLAADSCTIKGKVSLMSEDGIQQLQIFIFVLAVMQIVYSVLTMAFGRAKMRRWKAWEKETQTTEYQVANDPNRFRFTRQTTFGRRHTATCTETSLQLWTKCFFRQFFNSVAKVDYLTLRHGFISAHMSIRGNNFNFQKYIEGSLEEDFKVMASISPFMWLIVVIFILVGVHGWNVYLYISYVPLLMVLLLGTKLNVIVARMAQQLKNQNSVVIGTPLVQLNDDLFWFKRPRFVLTLLHLTLFVNAFELAFFIWVTIQFGVESCRHEHNAIIVTRVVLAVTVQVLCSYITLPLYALVTQMGSGFKSRAMEGQMARIMKEWHAEVRAKRKKKEQILLSTQSSLPTDWILRESSLHFSSQPQQRSIPSESYRLSSKREITEEEEDEVKNEAVETEPVSFRIHLAKSG